MKDSVTDLRVLMFAGNKMETSTNKMETSTTFAARGKISLREIGFGVSDHAMPKTSISFCSKSRFFNRASFVYVYAKFYDVVWEQLV